MLRFLEGGGGGGGGSFAIRQMLTIVDVKEAEPHYYVTFLVGGGGGGSFALRQMSTSVDVKEAQPRSLFYISRSFPKPRCK